MIFSSFSTRLGQVKLTIKNKKEIMTTEREKTAIQLAKKVFEHFTHDALPIAREIIAMELELKESPDEGESIIGVTFTDVHDFPVTDISAIGLDDPAQPVKHLNEELVSQQQDDFPF
jgi:hypothetical protein